MFNEKDDPRVIEIDNLKLELKILTDSMQTQQAQIAQAERESQDKIRDILQIKQENLEARMDEKIKQILCEKEKEQERYKLNEERLMMEIGKH